MHDGTKQMIKLAIEHVQDHGGSIYVKNGMDEYKVSYRNNETTIEKR